MSSNIPMRLIFSGMTFSRNNKAGQKADLTTLKTDFIRQYITRKIDFYGKAGLSFIDSFNDESFIRPVLEAAFSYQVDTITLAKLSFIRNTVTNPTSTNISDNWRTTASVTQQLSERF